MNEYMGKFHFGRVRYINKRLWLPKCLGGRWKWLVKATWKETYTPLYYTEDPLILHGRWTAQRWGGLKRSEHVKSEDNGETI